MSGINKFTEQPSHEEIVKKMQDIVDALGSAAGANTDLSNLSATGEAHFQAPLGYIPANTDLSNLSTTGKAVIGGIFVYNKIDIATATTINAGEYIEKSLSSYLPNDSYNYYVWVAATVRTSTTAGETARIFVSSGYTGYVAYGLELCGARCVNSYFNQSSGNAIIPVGANRKIYFSNMGTGKITNGYFSVVGYMRMGTNN